MKTIPYRLENTKALFTSRSGLICLGELFSQLDLANHIDQYFPAPGSNRGFSASQFVTPLLLMLHEGGDRLDDLSLICED